MPSTHLPSLPINNDWLDLVYVATQPWFAQRLERSGVPIKRECVREEVRYRPTTEAVGWNGHDSEAVADIAEDPDDSVPEHVEPAVYDYRVPKALADLYPNDQLAAWAARNFTPSGLEVMRALIDTVRGDSYSYVENIREMYKDSQVSEKPDDIDLNPWEKDM